MHSEALLICALLIAAGGALAVEANDTAPQFALSGIHHTEGQVALADYKGQVVWLDF